MVDYVNVDIVASQLQKSKGRKIKGSYIDLASMLHGEEFDFVFALNIFNPLSPVSRRTYEAMAADGHGPTKRRRYSHPIVDAFELHTLADQTMATEMAASTGYERLVLLNQVFAISPQGVIVRGGISFRDTLNGTIKYMQDHGLSRIITH